uniref:Splicing factor Cactin n=1 Tax=Ciona savignyi TaxID=51511 RepID=H2YJA3_CIOSA
KDEKKKKHRQRDRSSSSDSRSDSKEKRRSRIEAEKERMKAEKEKEKELMKAIETPEEKRARRLAKKEAKERKRREKMGWDKEYMGYTNTDNPFGDGKLLNTFVWHKKLEKQGLTHLPDEQKKKMIKQKQESNKIELAKRERERQQRDEEMEIMQREKEADHFKAWEDQEDKFHLEQAKLRSQIRIQDSRAKPIDLLANYASSAQEGAEDMSGVEMHEPYTYLNGLTMVDLEDLLEDIKVYMELEQDRNVEFWKDMTVITEDELHTLKKIAHDEVCIIVSLQLSIYPLITINDLLELLQCDFTAFGLAVSGSSVDIGYWESLLSQLKAFLARARLRDRHQALLQDKLHKLKLEQLGENEGERKTAPDESSEVSDPTEVDEDQVKEEENIEKEDKVTLTEGDLELKCMEEFDEGKVRRIGYRSIWFPSKYRSIWFPSKYRSIWFLSNYSPKLLRLRDLPPDVVLLDPEEDTMTIDGKRKLLTKTGDARSGQEDAFIRRAKEGMDTQEEATFAVEANLSHQVFLWADKYRPRKPRFFNRVHTGFEWNKYNQTHYDFDNPPPKVVQGYKFNIFYPDLIEKHVPPTYTITPDGDSTDFAVLRFSAGPPYQDIAFKIVNREWEYSHKHGFRCQFLNSIFQLWFHFKRYRYRR